MPKNAENRTFCALFTYFLRKKCGKPHFLALLLGSAETPLFVQINVFAVWALRLDRKYTILGPFGPRASVLSMHTMHKKLKEVLLARDLGQGYRAMVNRCEFLQTLCLIYSDYVLIYISNIDVRRLLLLVSEYVSTFRYIKNYV